MALSESIWAGVELRQDPAITAAAKAALPNCANKAFLGFDSRFAEPTVRVCCLCPDRAAVEWLCVRAGVDMTHTHCDPCHAAHMAELRKLSPKA